MINMHCFSMYNEKIYEFRHKSGLYVQILPKKGFRRKYAYLTTKFGSADSEYLCEGKKIKVPHGTAHFLEHKMFEKKDGDIFDKYSKTGANSNAFTGHLVTSYHFDCVDNFEENLNILFEQVFVPYFTPENVEKEKGIIIQEINMYRDDPYDVRYQEFLKLLYKNNPVKIDIGGTEETVRSITPEILYNCHKVFYRPDNMCLTVVGDVNVETIEKALDRAGLPKYTDNQIERIQPAEPEKPAGIRSVCQKDTSCPLFAFGFKDASSKYNSTEFLKRKIAGNFASDLIFDSVSELVDTMYRSGDIYTIYACYNINKNYSFYEIMGASEKPEKVEKAIGDYIAKIAEMGIDSKMFESLKRAYYSYNIRGFDSLSSIAIRLVHSYQDGYNLFDYFDAYGKITEADVNDFIRDLLCKEMVVTIVEPKGR